MKNESKLTHTLVLLCFGALLLFEIWPLLPGKHQKRPRTLILYGFSILGEVMNRGIFPAFKQEWIREHTDEDLEFISSFASSGTVTNQIILGVPAQLAILALELDADKLVDKGVLQAPNWRELPNHGIVNWTPFLILVRPGNPLKITDFSDLAKPGVKIIHPDPLTSGGAQWAILAEYGGLKLSGSPDAAYQQLLGIWRNVVAQSSSARGARTQFDVGFGDALITYEQDLLTDLKRNKLSGEIVYPKSTVMSEHVVVRIDKNIKAEDAELVQKFTEYLWSDKAQKIFLEYGFRTAAGRFAPSGFEFPAIEKPFTVKDLGGWREAKKSIIEGIWKQKVLPELGR